MKMKNQVERTDTFETMAFVARENDKFNDMDVTKEVIFSSKWTLPEPDMEIEANEMHEAVVNEITEYLLCRYA